MPPPPPPPPPTAATAAPSLLLSPFTSSAPRPLLSPTGQTLTPAQLEEVAYTARRCVDVVTLARLFRAVPPGVGLVPALMAVGKALVRDVTMLLPPPPAPPLPLAHAPLAPATAPPPTTFATPTAGSVHSFGGADAPASEAPWGGCPVVWDDDAATSAAGLPQVRADRVCVCVCVCVCVPAGGADSV